METKISDSQVLFLVNFDMSISLVIEGLFDMRNDMSTIFLQQILSDWLLLLGQKNNLSVSFKFELITTNYLWFVVKML